MKGEDNEAGLGAKVHDKLGRGCMGSLKSTKRSVCSRCHQLPIQTLHAANCHNCKLQHQGDTCPHHWVGCHPGAVREAGEFKGCERLVALNSECDKVVTDRI